MEENTSKLGVVEDQCHLEGLLEMESVIIDLCEGFKKEEMLINYKPKSYD
jgi:hypothetical protein